MLFQVWEQGRWASFLEFNLWWVQYFNLSTLAHWDSPSVWNLQFSLASSAVFLPLAVCKPKPPTSLGVVTFLHPTQCILCLVLVEFQRKFLFTRSMPSNIFPGSWLFCITYASIAEVEACIKTDRPAIKRMFAFHLASFFLTFSSTKLKSWLDTPRCFMGKPRYLPKLGVDWNPRMSPKASLWSLSKLGEKNTLDLASLTIYPDWLQKSSNTPLIVTQFSGFAFANRTRLSVKNRWYCKVCDYCHSSVLSS